MLSKYIIVDMCAKAVQSGAYFQRMTGTTFQFAQYRGAAPVM